MKMEDFDECLVEICVNKLYLYAYGIHCQMFLIDPKVTVIVVDTAKNLLLVEDGDTISIDYGLKWTGLATCRISGEHFKRRFILWHHLMGFFNF